MINFKEEVLKRKDQIIEDISSLCAIPSVYDANTVGQNQPYGIHCRRALDAMLEIGKRDGFVTYDDNGHAGHIDIGDQEGTFGILGHLDVVPVVASKWNSDPFKAVLQDGHLYGRGVADDKGPLIAGYYAAKIINDLKLPVNKKIRVIFGCDEERGSSCMKHYFAHNPYCDLGFTPDAEFPVVHGEKALCFSKINGDVKKDGLVALVAGTVVNIVPDECTAIIEGSYKQYEQSFKKFLEDHKVTGSIEEEGNCTRFVLNGKSSHSSMPEQGINAVVLMCQYLQPFTNNKLVDFICKHINDYYGESFGIGCSGAMGKLTLNLGTIAYKSEHFEMGLDMRCPHEIDLPKLAQTIEDVCTSYNFQVSSETHEGLYIDPNSDLVQKLHNAYLEVSGNHDKPQSIGGGTYAKSMPNCVAFGCQFPNTDNLIHGHNENMSVEHILQSTEIFAKAIYDLIKE